MRWNTLLNASVIIRWMKTLQSVATHFHIFCCTRRITAERYLLAAG